MKRFKERKNNVNDPLRSNILFCVLFALLILLIISSAWIEQKDYSDEEYCDLLEECEVFLCKSDRAYELKDADTARYFLERYDVCKEEGD